VNVCGGSREGSAAETREEGQILRGKGEGSALHMCIKRQLMKPTKLKRVKGKRGMERQWRG
jgi:hypothetical protein